MEIRYSPWANRRLLG